MSWGILHTDGRPGIGMIGAKPETWLNIPLEYLKYNV